MAGWKDAIKSLLSISTFQSPKPRMNIPLDSKPVEEIRESLGGQLQMMLTTQTRWYLADLEDAIRSADRGDLSAAGRLWAATNRDSVFAGIQNTRSEGVVNLPRNFRGERDWIDALELGHDGTAIDGARSVYDEMLPPGELAKMVRDGDGIGVAVGELMPVQGRDFPVLVTYSPECIRYIWSENRFYFQSAAGLLPITPGDGRWVLHIPGGRVEPWKSGYWAAAGKSFITKQHAESFKSNWESKLANSARAAISPQGAAEEQAQSWFRSVMGWGVNTVFGMRPGYDVKLIESNGRGHESFERTIDRCDREFATIVNGQDVTSSGGPGMINMDMFSRVSAGKIRYSAEGIAYTINTQVLPQFIVRRYGADALSRGSVVVAYDISPVRDQNAEAAALGAVGAAIKSVDDALQARGKRLDVLEVCTRFGVPLDSEYVPPKTTPIPIDLAPTDLAKAFSVDEVRASRQYPPVGDERGNLMLSEVSDGSTVGAIGGEDGEADTDGKLDVPDE